jgi:protein gp37
MGESTKIAWCHHTFNPWRGCSRISAGCDHCYAEQQAKRNPAVLGEWGPNGKRAIAAEAYWRLPVKWNRAAQAAGQRRRVFCGSLMDVLDLGPAGDANYENRASLTIARVRLFRLVEDTRWLDWLFLTKRIENARHMQPNRWEYDWPANVWLGTTIENQAAYHARAATLASIPAAVKFWSMEPLLDPVRFDDDWWESANVPDWVIAGGESGPNARLCDIAWIRSIVRQCQAARVPVFVKQLGARPINSNLPCPITCDCGLHFGFRDPKGGDPSEWPADLRVREFPRPTTNP